jgi:transposase
VLSDAPTSDPSTDASHRIVGLEAQLEQTKSSLEKTQGELAKTKDELERTKGDLEKIRHAYRRVLEELALMRKRLFVAKGERKDTTAEQLVFEGLLAEASLLERALEAAEQAQKAQQAEQKEQAEQKAPEPPAAPESPQKEDEPRPKPKGRRNLEESKLPVLRVEITDPELEGKAERIGFEESSRLGHERGGARRIVLARVIYKVEGDTTTTPSTEGERTSEEAERTDHEPVASAPPHAAEGAEPPPAPILPSEGRTQLITAPLPKELFRRRLLAPSMIAYILAGKYMMGLPFYRLEEKLAYDGACIDRGTMCRYAEDAGATLGAIVLAARDEAFATSFCLSTDATGVSIQPTPLDDGTRQPCRKGHFFVVLADRDHVFFEYQPKHTGAAVSEMFKGFSGYIQADAHAIYDALFRGPASPNPNGDASTGPPKEVGCWSHARRKFWEAAVCKHRIGVEGLARINAIFAADKPLWKLPPGKRHALRQQYVRPLVDSFFEWAKATQAVTSERGLVATALGYAVRQEAPLRRFLEDGRLRLENNGSERALRTIAVGRKSWLFCGSDDHASAAANLFSLIASCKLHALDPEAYLADVIRVMPYWPRDRYLELAPKYWARTRARLDPTELARPLGHISVPGPLPPEEQQPPR